MCETLSQWGFIRHRVSLDTGMTERVNVTSQGHTVVESTIVSLQH